MMREGVSFPERPGREHDDAVLASWHANARKWCQAVRGKQLDSRVRYTDTAILDAVRQCQAKRVLDLGCGEGWLVRAIKAEFDIECVGVDGVETLIAAAREADPSGSYVHATYRQLAAAQPLSGARFEAIVFNFALFGRHDDALTVQSAVRYLVPGGWLVMQTLPFACHAGEAHTERFAALPGEWTAMPYRTRSLCEWRQCAASTGLELVDTATIRNDAGLPVSQILIMGLA